MSHDPRAAALAARLQELVEEALHEHLDDVLGACPDADDAPDGTACSGFYHRLARDLAAAGLVVRPADDRGIPPWMERLRNSDGLYGHLHSKGCVWWLYPFSELANGCRPIYVRKENPDGK